MAKVQVNKETTEWKWVLAWAVAIVLLASVPYLFGLGITPPGYHFLGFTHNIDDTAVYLSWMRQAADGHFFIQNLFTNQPQAARAFNILTFAMGVKAGILHMSLAWMYHLTRIALGIALMFMVWQFSKLFLPDTAQRKLLIPLVGLSAGIGWLIPGVTMPVTSVDMWQPEAITFLAIYLNPLFLAGLILMLGSLYFLTLAERTGRARDAIYAGLCLLVLGNVHTYDVLTVTVMWISYVLVKGYARQAIPARLMWLTGLAGLIALPSVAYQIWLYRVDAVFHARANTMTESPVIWSFLAGYGLLVLGAIAAAVISTRQTQPGDTEDGVFWGKLAGNPMLLLIVWMVVGFALPYAPVAQQRKLIMGLHLPLCILCAYVLPGLIDRVPISMRRLALGALLIVLAGSNVRFLGSDMALLAKLETPPKYVPYMSTPELSAMAYLRKNAGPRDTILAPPSFALFVPGITGKQVYYGHWSETPAFPNKIKAWCEFRLHPDGPGGLVKKSRASYVVVEGDSDYLAGTDLARQKLTRVFNKPGEPGVFVYRTK